MNKKGVMFTMATILLSTIIITSLFFFQETRIDQELQPASLRMQTINNHIRLSGDFYSNLMSQYTYEALENITNMLIAEGDYFADFDIEIERCFINGSVLLGSSTNSCGDSFNKVLKSWDAYILENLNINSSSTITSINLTQETAWEVIAKFNLSLAIVDNYGTWKTQKSLVSTINIEGLKDPTYQIVHSDVESHSYENRINLSNRFDIGITTDFWQEKPSTLEQEVIDQKYFILNQTPSFLGRLKGDFSPSELGIVSIVKPSKTNINMNISHLDYLYWRQECVNGPHARYDFWSDDMNVADRFSMNINASNPGLQDAIVPFQLGVFTNMSDSKYYKPFTISCP